MAQATGQVIQIKIMLQPNGAVGMEFPDSGVSPLMVYGLLEAAKDIIRGHFAAKAEAGAGRVQEHTAAQMDAVDAVMPRLAVG